MLGAVRLSQPQKLSERLQRMTALSRSSSVLWLRVHDLLWGYLWDGQNKYGILKRNQRQRAEEFPPPAATSRNIPAIGDRLYGTAVVGGGPLGGGRRRESESLHAFNGAPNPWMGPGHSKGCPYGRRLEKPIRGLSATGYVAPAHERGWHPPSLDPFEAIAHDGEASGVADRGAQCPVTGAGGPGGDDGGA